MAQDRLSLGFNAAGLEEVFLRVGEKYNVTLLYPPEVMATGIKVTLPPKKRTLPEMLDLLRKETRLQYELQGKTVTVRTPLLSPERKIPAETGFLLVGRVLDNEGTPLAGVTVRDHNNGAGSVTGEKGEYRIHVFPGDQLSFSLMGYRARQVSAGRKMPPAVVLEENVVNLGTTVVTGYTIKRAEELTGALSKLKGEDVRHGVTSADATSMIKGKGSGLYITEQLSANPAGAGGKILMRGQSSLLGTQQTQPTNRNYAVFPASPNVVLGPLIVVDGMITPYSDLKDAVNPEDIEELRVLKDAAATAIYGSRSAGGVIEIVTRRGRRGKMRFSLEAKAGLNSPNRGKFRWMDANELYDARTELFTQGWAEYGNVWKASFDVSSLPELLNKALPTREEMAHSFDWTKYYYVRSRLQEINISASGGNARSRYYLAASHYYEQGTLRDNSLRRMSFRLNFDQELSKALSLKIGLNGIFDHETQPVVPPGLHELPSWISPYDENGELRPSLSLIGVPGVQLLNFLFERQYNSKRYRQKNLSGNMKLTWRLTDWLSVSSANAGNIMRGAGEYNADARSLLGKFLSADNNGFLLTGGDDLDYFITSNTMTLERRYEKHWLRLLAGQEFQQFLGKKKGLNLEALIPGSINTLSDVAARELPLLPDHNFPLTWMDIYGGKRKSRMFSLFSEAAYSYRNKYFISASLRNDASSEFSPGNRNAAFWSAGASWLVNKEPFMQARRAINLLKLRVNAGTSGSQMGNRVLTKTIYGLNSTQGLPDDRYYGELGVYPLQTGNPQLTWETTRTLNIGMDMGLLDRIAISLDYYRKRSFNLIQELPQSAAAGNLSRQFSNTGVLGNYGLEITLNTQNISTNKFSWSSSFNIAFNRNRIISVQGGALAVGYGGNVANAQGAVRKYYLYPGEDINTLKGVIYAGVDPATGKPLFEKPVRDGDGNIISIEKTGSIQEALGPDGKGHQTLGTKTPKFNGGISNTLKYGNFTLSMLAEFVYGTRSLNFERAEFQAGDGIPVQFAATNRVAYAPFQHPWRYPGDKEANMPSIYEATRINFFDIRNSYFYENNSFLRIRNIQLNYRLPENWLGRFIERAEICLSVDNLYTFTSKYFTQTDPEGAYVGGDQFSSFSGVGGGLGLPKRYLASLRFNFK